MKSACGSVVLATVSLYIPLLLWRSVYPTSDWGVIFLLILAFMLFGGAFSPAAATYRARLSIEIRKSSFLAGILTGRLHATFFALVFTGAAIPVLAWQALTASWPEILCFVFLSVTSSAFSLFTHAKLKQHLSPWLARSASITIGALGSAIIFIPIIMWVNWAYVTHAGQLRSDTLQQSIVFYIQKLPARGGWVAEILSVFYALDGAKFWLVMRLSSFNWILVLYAFNAALPSLFIAQSSAILSSFSENRIKDLSL